MDALNALRETYTDWDRIVEPGAEANHWPGIFAPGSLMNCECRSYLSAFSQVSKGGVAQTHTSEWSEETISGCRRPARPVGATLWPSALA